MVIFLEGFGKFMAFKAGKLHDDDNSPPAPVQVANDEEDVESQPIPRTQHHFFKKSFFFGVFLVYPHVSPECFAVCSALT